MLTALVSIMLLFQITTNGTLLQPINLTNLILQNSYILIMAIGMLLVILTGNIDLSVGSIAAFIGAISAFMIINMKLPVMPSILLSLLIGALAGAWQGYWIAYVKIPSFIVTLAGMLIFRGLTMVMLQGKTLAPFPKSYTMISAAFVPDFLGRADGIHMTTVVIGIVCSIMYILAELKNRRNKQKYNFEVAPMPVLIVKMIMMVAVFSAFSYWIASYKGIPSVLILLAVLILVYSFITNRTVPGRHVYALGGNAKAAMLSGIETKKVLFWVYVNMGVLAALAGIVFAGRLNAATPKAGVNFELDAIAACYIGGASATGGIGTVSGAIIGGLIMGVLNNGMSIMGVSVDWQQSIKGLVLLLAVAFDIYSKSKSVKA